MGSSFRVGVVENGTEQNRRPVPVDQRGRGVLAGAATPRTTAAERPRASDDVHVAQNFANEICDSLKEVLNKVAARL